MPTSWEQTFVQKISLKIPLVELTYPKAYYMYASVHLFSLEGRKFFSIFLRTYENVAPSFRAYTFYFSPLQENVKRKERRDSDCSRLSAGKGMAASQEDRIVGTISAGLYWDYFRSGLHGVLLLFLLLLFFIAQGMYGYFRGNYATLITGVDERLENTVEGS